jgi:Protein of unknown function (DUF3987)
MDCVKSGLSSGEGIVWRIRDKVEKDGKVVDEGVDDKRLYLDEREFFQVLAVMKRDGSTVSVVIRNAFDSVPVGGLTKKDQTWCREPHISIMGHITKEELVKTLDQVSMTNGYANRFLYFMVRISKKLPFPKHPPQDKLNEVCAKINEVVNKWMQGLSPVRIAFDEASEAGQLWNSVYGELTASRPGILGGITGRAAPKVLRLAMFYAAVDLSDKIEAVHLKAALALHQYCVDSAKYIWGDLTGDPVADDLLVALRHTEGGMTRTEMSNAFGRNMSAMKISAALRLLLDYKKVKEDTRVVGSKSLKVWKAI